MAGRSRMRRFSVPSPRHPRDDTAVTLSTLLRRLGRLARPLFRPDWDEEQKAASRLASRVDSLQRLPEVTATHAAALAALRDSVEAVKGREVVHLRRQMMELRRAVLAHTRITGKALHHAEFLDEHASQAYALERLLERARRTGRPLLAGPWTGEVGFEVLYWVPFLRKLKTRLPEGAQLHVLSRGGAAPWYSGIASRYQDVFDLVPPDEFRRETERETRKQRTIGAFDRRLIREGSARLGLSGPIVIHPSLMYELLYPYWKDQLAVRSLDDYLAPALLPAPDAPLPAGLQLPASFVAARFYFSQCFPDTPANRALVRDVLTRVAAGRPVVLLQTPFAVDDHRDADVEIPGALSVSSYLTPENNLAVQSAIISRADAFIGTYGGFSYVAPLYRVPSITFYSEATFFEQHLEFARRSFTRAGAAPFIVLHESERRLMDELLVPSR